MASIAATVSSLKADLPIRIMSEGSMAPSRGPGGSTAYAGSSAGALGAPDPAWPGWPAGAGSAEPDVPPSVLDPVLAPAAGSSPSEGDAHEGSTARATTSPVVVSVRLMLM
ncbi:hypothetical protein NPS01_30050 [Nocardioides psychrotolerans]|nr:hypothetical protein NPS01_30050 [Nocardioides psychrotolerans]